MLKAQGINKIYKDGRKKLHVLKDVELTLSKGEVLAITGPSGAGKSTLLHILGGIDRPTKGKVLFNDLDIYSLQDIERAKFRNKNIGFVFQFYHLLPEFTALENTMMPALLRDEEFMIKSSWVKRSASMVLDELGLRDRLNHRPRALSGGEQQRVAIARALVNTPEILLCDEPTGNLDSKMGEDILKILFSLSGKNYTSVIIVTHDKEIAKKAHRIIEMKDGYLV